MAAIVHALVTVVSLTAVPDPLVCVLAPFLLNVIVIVLAAFVVWA